MPGQVIGYVRVSTIDQNPERQLAAIRATLGAEPDHWFTDRASGGSTTRPALAGMLAHVRDQDEILVASMDRLARSVVDLDQLVTQLTGRGVAVRFLKERLTFQAAGRADPLAVFQLQAMGAFAQLERALIRDRQREGIDAAKARGVSRGRARRLTPEQVDAVIAEIAAGVPKAEVARRLGVMRPDGRWRARYRDDAGQEHAKHFSRRVDAQRWLDSITASLVRGDYVDPRAGSIALLEFYEVWASRQVWASGTRRPMDLAVRSFPNLPLRSLRRSHVEAWVKRMSNAGLAAGTIHTRVQNVRSVLRAAVADNLIALDPSAGVTLPRRRRREASMSIPSPEIVGRLMDASDQAALIGVCAFAGLRLGEAAALQPGDLDVAGCTLQVRRQVQRGTPSTNIEIKAPKAGSERVVFIPDRLAALLHDHLETTGRTEWLFAEDGQPPPHQNTVGHWWRTACKHVGVSYRLHDLRHFYASGLIAAGCDVVTVQRALGHARATTTLDTYSHLWPTAEDRTRKAAGDLFADSLRTARGMRAV